MNERVGLGNYNGFLNNNIDIEIKNILEMLKNNEISKDEAMTKINHIKKNNKELNLNEILCYANNWEKTKLLNHTINTQGIKKLLVFDINDFFENNYRQVINNSMSDIVIIKIGKEYKKISQHEYMINPDKYENYINVFTELSNMEFYPDNILHLWTLGNNTHNYYNNEEVLNLGCYSIFNIITSLHKVKIKSLKKLMVILDGIEESTNPYHLCIKGFTTSIVKIMPKLIFSTVQIPFVKFEKEVLQTILKELSIITGTVNLDIKYKEDERYVRKINKIELDNVGNISIKYKGVYLITGGAGGLGLIFSRYLAKEYKAKLILTGRSKLSVEREEVIKDIRDLGGEVLYLQADVGDIEAMKKVVNIIKAEYGNINGIIHAGGINSDKLLIEKDITEFKRVLWPKVQGTMVLDEVTKEEDLDFMLMFSSTSSIIGDFGQGDYTVANKYLDEFKDYREGLREQNKRKGITKVINWPLWREGGMHFDKNSEELYLRTSGMSYLENKDGFEIFENILASKTNEAIIFTGNKKKIQSMIDLQNNGSLIVHNKDSSKKTTSFNSYSPKELSFEKRVEYDILKITSNILKIKMSILDLNENLGSYGFDSIGLKEFADKLSLFFDMEILPIVFFDKSTLNELINYFAVDLKHEIQPLYMDENEDKDIISTRILQKNEKIEKVANIEYEKSQNSIKDNYKEPIAIIGLSGKFPCSNNIDEFWNNLESKNNLIKEIPTERWDWRDYFDETRYNYNAFPKWGGFIEDIDKFDAKFFNLSRREVEYMDPKQRLLVQSVWETIEDAGYKPSSLSGRRIGVFIGAQANEYQELFPKNEGTLAQHVTGNANSLLSNRISFIFNFRGASETIDTACSSSLVAIHRAVKSIQNKESEVAIAGGISLILSPSVFMGTINLGILSPDGKCKTFDKNANGYVKGEGFGTLLLKPLSKAIEDNDNIYAVIKGSAEGHGGRANSLTAPNSDAQAELLINAYKDANVNPNTVTYLEAHGTGTELGDPVEIQGIKKAFVSNNSHEFEKKYCAIGSVKTNVGHLEPASGVAGIIKVILCMKNKKLTGLLNFNELNPYIKLDETQFYILNDSKNWERIKDTNGNIIPRRAGISSFGFGGTNAHIVVEEYIEEQDPVINNDEEIFVLSANNKDRLKEYAKKMSTFIDKVFFQDTTSLNEQKIIFNIKKDLIDIAANIINVPSNEIDCTDNLEEYGFDLVKLSELFNKTIDKYKIDNLIQMDFNNKSIQEIAYLIFESNKNIILKCYPDNMSNTIKKPTISMKEIAYTLQVGRENMSERLGIVASSPFDLKEKLNSFINGENDSKNIFRGTVQHKDKTDVLVEGEEGRIFINALMKNNKLNKIAKIWVTGGDINWNDLQKNAKIRKISLPTYPFAKESYWISKEENAVINTINNYEKISKLHPMIDMNTSTLKSQQYTTIINGEEFYIKDHVIGGDRIMPGVAYVEMARAAGELSCSSRISSVKDIVWIKPIIYDTSSKNEIKIELFPKDDCIQYDIFSTNEEFERILHGQGRLIIDKSINNEIKVVNIEDIKKRCTKIITREECYNSYKKAGYEYGTGFKGIVKMYSSEEEVLAMIRIPESLIDSSDQFVLHPTLMDGALQAISGLGINNDNTTYLPFALGEVQIIGKLKDVCYAYITFKETNSNIKKYNVDLLDDNGSEIIKIHDFSVRAISQNKNNILPDTLYYSKEWKEEQISDNDIIKLDGNILIFDEDENVTTKIKDTFTDNKVILIRKGQEYRKINDYEYEINHNNAGDYYKLLEIFKDMELDISYIFHLWSKNDNNQSINKKLQESVYSLFYICSGLIQQKLINKLKIIFAHNKIDEPEYAAINSFLNTISLENSKITYKTIAYNVGSQITNILLSELNNDSNEVMYSNGKRLIGQIKDLQDFKNRLNIKETLLKENGVYIITGGAGGLGIIFGKYLAKKYNARIILTGRSELDTNKKDIVNSIGEYGNEIIYIKADVSKRNDVENLIISVKERFNEINGIIHSAGIIKDAYLLNKTKDDFEQVIAPKIHGTTYLDELTKNEKIDFFVMFSSVASVFGNPGQTDYAYANSFIDNYARRRDKLVKEGKRFGKTVSINWPLWRNGGMQVDEQTEKMIEQSYGFKLLETEMGLEAFELSLIQDKVQLMVVSGDSRKIKNIINNKTDDIKYERTDVDVTNSNDLINSVEEDIVNIVSKIIKMDREEIEFDIDLSEFGFDSITFTEFSNMLSDKFEVFVMPSIFYEHANLGSFITYFVNEYNEKLNSHYGSKISNSKNIVFEGIDEDNADEVVRQRFLNDKKTMSEKSNLVNKVDEQEPIAIIGMSGIMPESEDLNEFWNNIVSERDLIKEIPKERWDWEKIYGDPLDEANKTNIKWGGFMKEVDKFDPLFFGISPNEAKLMDPQQRLFIETVWKTIEDAGYKSIDLSGTKTGVYVGVGTADYSEIIKERCTEIQAQSSTGISHSVLANRISYLLNFHGPSEPIDTACSSALVAIHRAVEDIQRGNCEMAIAGGINVMVSPTLYISFSKAGMLSKDGKCKTFDKGANGYVRGEGVGAILLKPLSKAEEDGDYIYGVIKGSNVNHGGHVNSLTTPNPNAQAEVIVNAWKKAKVNPETISYIEAHGTGTSLGDPIEINGLKKAFNQLYEETGNKTPIQSHCGIGSVKTNIGHLECAAGIAGILKVLLAMKNKKIPASINFEEINPYINLEDSPFYIVDKTIKWDNVNNVPRRAGVSSFGFGGINAHVVIEEYEMSQNRLNDDKERIIILSAKNRERIRDYVKKLYDYVSIDESEINLDALAYTFQVGRNEMDERLAMIVSNVDELKEKISMFLSNKENIPDLYLGKVDKKNSKNIKNNNIEELISNKNLKEVAKLWVAGLAIDWKKLYSSKMLKSPLLPTYPFARESYWVFDDEKVEINEVIKAVDIDDEVGDEKIIEKVKQNVLKFMSSILGINQSEFDINTNISEYGIDSISMMQLVNSIKKEYDLTSNSNIFQQDTVKGIVQSICLDLLSNSKVAISQEKNHTTGSIKVENTRKRITLDKVPLDKDGSSLATKNILLNGVTGVLGGRLIKDYLEKTDSILYCIVRSESIQKGKERIKEMLNVHDYENALDEDFNKRVIPVLGDITHPFLGLDENMYSELVEKIDMVVHVAAKTSLHGFYEEVKDVNVDGTKNMIDFTLKTKQKYFIHTSTIAIMGDRLFKNCPPFKEKDYELGQGFENLGYAKSKFEAEELVHIASKKGLKFIIARAGYIMGDSNNGRYPFGLTSVPGIFYDYIKTAIELKTFYNSPFFFDVTPVNYVSSGIVYLSTELKNIYQTYHLNNPHVRTLNDIMYYLNKYGYKVDIISYDKFIKKIEREDNGYKSLTTELMLLNSMDNIEGFSYVDATYTKKVLEKANITCPKVDEKLIGTYLNYCIEVGYLKKPS